MPAPKTEAQIVAHAERMLDAAPLAGVDLAGLDRARRLLLTHEDELHRARSASRRAMLVRAVEGDVEVLAVAYLRLEAAIERSP